MTTTTAPALTVQEILLGAGEHILKVGLHRDDFFPKQWNGKGGRDVRCCTAAAIRLAGGMTIADIMLGSIEPTSDEILEAEGLLAEYLVDAMGAEPGGTALDTIGTWNDQDGRTAAEVAEILRDVAEMAR